MTQTTPDAALGTPYAPDAAEVDSKMSAAPVMPLVLYGFFHTTCVHESAERLVTAHLTKAGAWRAMWRFKWKAWEEAAAQTRLRESGAKRRTSEPLIGVDSYWKKALIGERSSVRAFDVHPD